MKAVLFDGHLKYADTSTREPQPGEVIVDVLHAGICETDLQLCQGYMGFRGVLGHEFVGIPRTGRFAGRRVVGEINCGCRSCEYCRKGLVNHCPDRTVVGIVRHDGAFAEYLILPEDNLHLIPDSLSSDDAVFVEPVAAACRIPEQIAFSGGEQVTVLGDGRLGNLCAQVLRHHGCCVRVVGKHDFKLNLLRDLGFECLTADQLPERREADMVVDCTGSPSGLSTALRIVRPCGTIVLKTTVAASQSMHMAPFVIDEIRLIGSRCGPFQPAIELLSAGVISTAPLITARYPLSSAIEAFEHATQKNSLKVLFTVRPDPCVN